MERAHGKLLVSRDRFGKKPFYFVHGPAGFAFASEPKALLELHPERRKVSDTALRRFLATGRMSGEGESFYDGIELLPAASWGEYDPASGRFEVHRYCSIRRKMRSMPVRPKNCSTPSRLCC